MNSSLFVKVNTVGNRFVILIIFFVLIGTLGAGDIITPNGVVSGSESASKVASIGEYEKLESS